MTTFTPTTATEVLSTVQWATGERAPLEIIGHGSKRGIGQPLQTEHTLDLSKLSGVTLYEPEELVLSARAGTPLAEIEKLLADSGQELAFEPMDYGPLHAGAPNSGTIGGALAANISGPRRIKAGAARDHVLGINAVSGRGEAFKSGGRVVKNVTGYDMSKLIAGSWGTLAALTDVTFKVLPAAEAETTLVLRGLFDDAAVAAMAVAMGSSAEVSSAAHLPESLSSRIGEALAGTPATLLRVEGFGPSVAYRVDHLKALFGAAESIDTIAGDPSKAIWRAVRDCMPFADGTEKPVWRVSMAPSETHKVVMALHMQIAVDAYYDWAGGLAWLRIDDDPQADLLRGLIRKFGGGHATLVRASPAYRTAIPVFEPQAPALAGLSARLKDQFDPNGIFNPGRMAGAQVSAKVVA